MANNTRRDFIKKAAVGATGFFIVPRHVVGGTGFTAPSDQLNIAGIGIGGKGKSDIIYASVKDRERVVALCDIDPEDKKNGVVDVRKAFPKAKIYTKFRKLLDEQKDLDAVTISTPDHTHAVIALEAMRRGIHVYVQKPLTHNIKEARMLTEAAKKYKVVTQMGNQGASNLGMVKLQEWIDKNMIGKISRTYVWTNRPVWPQGIAVPKPTDKVPKNLDWDMWLGPAKKIPYTSAYHPFSWRGWWEYGTGALGDMGCHLMDIPYRTLNLNYPTAVECSVGSVFSKMWVPDYIPEGCPPSSQVVINFEPTSKNPVPLTITWLDGGIRPPHPDLIPPDEDMGQKGSGNGVIMIGENGIITASVYGRIPKLYRKGEKTLAFETDTKENNAEPEHGHQRKWIDACKAGFESKEHRALTSSFDYAGRMTETVLMGNLAVRSYMLRRKVKEDSYEYYGRKKLLWDGDNMKITNLEEANQFVTREYRKGWEVKI